MKYPTFILIVLLISKLSFAQDFTDILKEGCKKHTSRISLGRLCIQLRVSPEWARACKENTANESLERECLINYNSLSKEILQGCHRYPSTISLKRLCLQLRVSPEMAKVCNENTPNQTLERECLVASIYED